MEMKMNHPLNSIRYANTVEKLSYFISRLGKTLDKIDAYLDIKIEKAEERKKAEALRNKRIKEMIEGKRDPLENND